MNNFEFRGQSSKPMLLSHDLNNHYKQLINNNKNEIKRQNNNENNLNFIKKDSIEK